MFIKFTKTTILLSLLLLSLSGCFRKKKPELSEVSPHMESAKIQNWHTQSISRWQHFGEPIEAWNSWRGHLKRSIDFLKQRSSLPPSYTQPPVKKQQIIANLELLLKISSSSSKEFWRQLDQNFIAIYPVGDREQPAFFTGYYTPLYRGSRQPTQRFQYPVYAAPADLKVKPDSYSRRAIDADGVLKGKGLEICYLENPLDPYLLQVQGSGTVTLENGERLGLGYGGTNNKTYTSLGKLLIQDGKITKQDISLTAIRNYFKKYPQQLPKYTLQNERYIFFQESDGRPRGSTGAIVEGYHSLAMERDAKRKYRFIPHLPLLITLPMGKNGNKTLLALNQDTGSAILGDARADIYCGVGQMAENVAGNIKHTGDIVLLWPKNQPLPKKIGGKPLIKQAGRTKYQF
jgi:membrane-bound lytic murein transglycosylase A